MQSHHQRASCRFVAMPVYDTYNPDIDTGAFTFFDMINIFPRYSWVALDSGVDLYGNQSLQRGGAAATGHAWSVQAAGGGAAAGSINAVGDECGYSAPSVGSGVDVVILSTDGDNGGLGAYIAYGDTSLNVGEVTSYHSDIESGGWTMVVRGYGDCDAFDRHDGILLILDSYWNGVRNNLTGGGGDEWDNIYEYPQGQFFGYVHRKRTIHEDSETAYVELTLISIAQHLNYGFVDPMFWATAGSDEEITVADLKVLDIPWGVLQKFPNTRHNVIIYTDTTAITNLKTSTGPTWDVLMDVCKRTFSTMYITRMGDIFVMPDPDIRWDERPAAGAATRDIILDTAMFSSIDIVSEDVAGALGDPRNPDDPTVGQVVLRAVQPDLSEIWARFPSDVIYTVGRRVEVGGLVCETAATLGTWAERYYYKVQPVQEVDLSVFQLPTLELMTWVDLDYTPNTDRITNTGISTIHEDYYYITSIDVDLDPGMGTCRGSVHMRAQTLESDTGNSTTGSG